MKNVAFVIAMLFVALSVFAQPTIQRGVAYRYNGKNQRTPIGGVYLKPATADNGVVSDEADGTFALSLKNRKMGDRIGSVRVTKQGMMVFNQQAVDEWSVRKEPLRLILCDAGEFQQQKRNLIAIGEREARKKYDKRLAELKRQNEAKQLELDDYYTKLDSLEKELQNALKHMNEYADVFARIDESEIDSLAQRAVELFNKGEIEESIRLLEEGNYEKRLDDALRTKSQAQELRHLADSAEALADNDIDRCMNAIKTQVSAYKLNNDFQKAGTLLKSMADKLQTLDATWDYAMFCYDQNQFADAETYFLKYEEILKRTPSDNKDALNANLYIDLGNVYVVLKRFADSEELYKKALSIRERLAKQNPKVYEHDLASVYNNLASVYSDANRIEDSEDLFKKGLIIIERLAKQNSIRYEPDLALIYNNLANLYARSNRIEEAVEMGKKALLIRDSLANQNPKVYEIDLAVSYNNLGIFYFRSNRFGESEKMFQLSTSLYLKLYASNQKIYSKPLSRCFYWLGNLMAIDEKTREAIEDFENVLKIAKEVKQDKTDSLIYNLSLLNLVDFYIKEKDYASAYKHNVEWLSTSYNKENYNYRLVVQSFLANLLGKFNEGEIYSQEALQVDSTNHVTYCNLAAALLFQGRVAEAEKLYRQYKKELKDTFLDDLAEYERLKVIPKERIADVERIKKMLMAE